MVMGLNPDLDEAMKIAMRETIDFITGKFPHLTRDRQRGGGLSRHTGRRWHQGGPRNDPEVHL
jgi:hypothetical protein